MRAALIDMDGVLYDSMPHHARAWQAMMTEAGIKTEPNEFYLYEGMTGAATIDLIFMRELHRHATPEEQHTLYQRKTDIFNASGKKTLMPGAAEMLQSLMDAGLKRVLVTGSGQASLLDNISHDYPGAFLPGMSVTAHDVTKGKPDAEPYLKGAAKAHAEPVEAIVIENAPMGVKAGKAAGCFTIAVTTGPIPVKAFEEAGADLIFPSMPEFAEWLREELEKRISARESLVRRLDAAVEALNAPTVTVVTDSNVERDVMHLFYDSRTIGAQVGNLLYGDGSKVVLAPGEDHKNLESAMTIWNVLEEAGATRKSAVVNIGGGLVTDIGGFAAACFKRGIRFVNVPTTLLGAVDAATGGKTGINFNGLKNEIGAFHLPSDVIISALPLLSLSEREIMSGYAEMVKTALIADANLYEKLLNPERVTEDIDCLEDAMKRCVEIKEEVVAADPTEKGLRKILNFGHTAGHAFESLSFEKNKPLAHGEAVAHGMLVELILSHIAKGMESGVIERYASCILKPFYPRAGVTCNDMDRLMEFMAHDKKNATAGSPNFTLLTAVGSPVIDCLPAESDIRASFDIYLDLMG